jgi:predicted nucleic acid-binding protein
MKVCFDTSILVAALVEDHPHHAPAFSVLLSAKDKKIEAYISTHALAELYAVLTRAPFTPPIYPAEARQMVEQSILPLVEVVSLSGVEYRGVVDECAEAGWTGGAIYDAIHIRAAKKAHCERLYTFNVKHFRAMAGDDFQDRISAP